MFHRNWLALFLLGISATTVAAQDVIIPQLPSDPARWINGGPITNDMLKGKAAFLWFFEEQCPRCRERWSELQAISKKYEDQAIVFIAVNSGNAREQMEAYAKEVKLNWPIIVDSDRAFEKLCGQSEISLQNITQANVILPDGKFGVGSWKDPAGSAEEAAKGAKWQGDPASVPVSLLPAWRALQFGLLNRAAGPITAGLASEDPLVKAKAEQLDAYVQGKIQTQMQAAKEAHRNGEKWKSYKMVTAISSQFAGYKLPDGVAAAKVALAQDEQVRKEVTAKNELESLKKRARTAAPVAMRGLVIKLKELIEKYPDTEAAVEGKTLLDSVPANPG